MAEKKNPDQVWREKKDDEEEDDPREKVSNHSSDDEESDSDNYQSGEDDIDGAIAAAGDQGITRELLDLRLKAGKEEPELEPVSPNNKFWCSMWVF